jgi:hypothetical protein
LSFRQVARLREHLEPLRAGTPRVSTAELDALDAEWTKWRSEWVRRRKVFYKCARLFSLSSRVSLCAPGAYASKRRCPMVRYALCLSLVVPLLLYCCYCTASATCHSGVHFLFLIALTHNKRNDDLQRPICNKGLIYLFVIGSRTY